MITWANVSVRYGDQKPVLRSVTATAQEGEATLVIGGTGSGKSTLLRTANGLVPYFTGGTVEGTVLVDGLDTREHRPRDLSWLVGYVGQDPVSGFVTDTVESELAYGMELAAIAPSTMRRRVEEVLDLLGMADLRDRRLATLSGGQAQRVAIGAALATSPKILVLDEPTSALDPTAAEDVLGLVSRLVHDLALTVLIAEHRLERIVQFADSVMYIDENGQVSQDAPAVVMETSPIAPPVVRLSRLAGVVPPSLTVREARRTCSALRDQLAARQPPATAQPPATDQPGHGVAADIHDLSVNYGAVRALRSCSLTIAASSVTALMGRNGSGKSTLLWAIQGGVARSAGRIGIGPNLADPARANAKGARALVALVPQTPGDLVVHDTVARECAQADAAAGVSAGTCQGLWRDMVGQVDPARHPRDLSEGQLLALVLAMQLCWAPPLVLLDEPTRGLDYRGKGVLSRIVRSLAATGTAVIIATHDVEFAAECCDRTIHLAGGEVVADGPTREVLLSFPAYAPQVAKVMAPEPWLTVEEVDAALTGRDENSTANGVGVR